MGNKISVPSEGTTIKLQDNELVIPDRPIIPFIEGDGIGPDIWKASQNVFDAAVEKAYGSRKKIAWMEIFAGEKAKKMFDEWLPRETVEAIRTYFIAIKGPLTTPVGGGFRSLNVTLRQVLNLYACIRPVKYYRGVPSPVRQPEKMNVIVFRENTEDVYAGIEWAMGSREAKKVI
ncbi:MAG: NADP-dependent isocitrate dehydrogenase, partial [Calditrichaeota bacterium]